MLLPRAPVDLPSTLQKPDVGADEHVLCALAFGWSLYA
jgi:hypothetical protein